MVTSIVRRLQWTPVADSSVFSQPRSPLTILVDLQEPYIVSMSSGELGGGSLTINPQDAWINFSNTRVTQVHGVSPRDHQDVVQHARQRIDDEEAALLATIPSLRARRNALSRVSSLPFEILGHVFHFHATNEPPTTGSLGWIQATHVCRLWRETALQTPSLWSDVTDRLGQEWTKEMFSRAKSAPISYFQYMPMRPSSSTSIAGHVLAEQLFRIRHLSITEPTENMNAILQTMRAYPAPILQSLYLKDERAILHSGCTLPSDIFNSNAPMLRRIKVEGFRIPWSTPILRDLVHLHIDNNLDDWRDAPATDGNVAVYKQFFSVLREMSYLETLFLSHCLPVEPSSPPRIQTVMLPRVQKLTLGSGFPVEIKNFLKHIAVPASCDVTIECQELDPQPSPDAFSFVTTHVLSRANEEPSLTMFLSTTTLSDGRISYESQWHLRFWAAGSVPGIAGLRQDPEDDPSISILVEMWPDDMYANVRALCECLPKDIIRDLIIDSDGAREWSWTPEDWLHGFEGYTAVENISVTGQVARTICSALGISTSPMTSLAQIVAQAEDQNLLSQEELFFGRLQRVEFNYVDFYFDYATDVYEDDESGEVSYAIRKTVYILLKTSLLHRRAAFDTRLTLFIRQCTISADQIRELREIAEVNWDGVTGPAQPIIEGGVGEIESLFGIVV